MAKPKTRYGSQGEEDPGKGSGILGSSRPRAVCGAKRCLGPAYSKKSIPTYQSRCFCCIGKVFHLACMPFCSGSSYDAPNHNTFVAMKKGVGTLCDFSVGQSYVEAGSHNQSLLAIRSKNLTPVRNWFEHRYTPAARGTKSSLPRQSSSRSAGVVSSSGAV